MLISEITFPHLQSEREAQLTQELERRRVITERLESEPVTAHRSRSSKVARRAAAPASQRSGDGLTRSEWASTLKA